MYNNPYIYSISFQPPSAYLVQASFTQLYEELVATRLKDQASPGSKQNPQGAHGIFAGVLMDFWSFEWSLDGLLMIFRWIVEVFVLDLDMFDVNCQVIGP